MSAQPSSESTTATVSFRRLPLIRMVSPRKNCSSSIFFGDMYTIEESSELDSSTRSLFGDALPCKIAVERSLAKD